MNSFVYDICTKVYFGPENMKYLGQEIRKWGSKLFFMYDGDYIKKNGIYELVMKASRDYGFDVVEFTKIKPNPRHTDVAEGRDLCVKENCDVILAVGGGSTIDSAKIISSASLINGDIWDIVLGKYPVEKSLPLITISTISATGSEMNYGGVISNLETKDKQSLRRICQRPKVTFLNPEYTFTVGKFQTACGSVDILCHTIETYFTNDDCMYFLDTVMEGIVRTVLKYAPIAYNDPSNYEARSNLMWAASWALNDFIKNDKTKAWTMHPIEHELSAFSDITHGLGLAILMPRYLKHIIDEKSLIRFRNLGIYGFSINDKMSDQEIAQEVINRIEKFEFETLGLESRFSNTKVSSKDFPTIAGKLAVDHGYYTAGYRPLSKDEIVTILNECY